MISDDVEYSDSYYDDRVTGDVSTLPPRASKSTQIHYTNELSIPTFKLVYKSDATPSSIPIVALNRNKSVLSLAGQELGSVIKINDGSSKVKRILRELCLGPNIKRFENDIAAVYESNNWPFRRIMFGDIPDLFGEPVAIMPDDEIDVHSKAVSELDEQLHKEAEIGRLLAEYQNPSLVASQLGITRKEVMAVYHYVRRFGKLPSSVRFKRKQRALPDYITIKKMLDEAYVKDGTIARCWSKFVSSLKEKYPRLNSLKDKTVENKARVLYKVKSLKAARAKANGNVVDQMESQLCIGWLLLQLKLQEKPVLCYDQSSFYYVPKITHLLGTSLYRPSVKFSPGKQVYLHCTSYQGKIFSFQLSEEHPNNASVHYFLKASCAKFMQLSSTDKGAFLFLDNARYHHSKALLKDLTTSIGIGVIYNQPCSPKLNHIEDVFMLLKQYLRQHEYEGIDEFSDVFVDALRFADENSSVTWRRFFDNLLKLLQRYRSVVLDKSLPSTIRKYILSKSISTN